MTTTTQNSDVEQREPEILARWRRGLKVRRRVKRGLSDRSGDPSLWQEAAIRALEDAPAVDGVEDWN
jgi:hypothetical protein